MKARHSFQPSNLLKIFEASNNPVATSITEAAKIRDATATTEAAINPDVSDNESD